MHRPPHQSFALGLLVCACTQSPSVEVNVRVGDRWQDEASAATARATLESLAGKVETWMDAVPDSARDELGAGVSKPSAPLAAGASSSPLEAAVTRVREGQHARLPAHAQALAKLSEENWPEVRARLLADLEAPKSDYAEILKLIGGDTPNRYGNFILELQRQRGREVRISSDWFEDLLAVHPARVSPALRPVYRDCIVRVALLRATARWIRDHSPHTTEIMSTLLDVAFANGGLFRAEVSRAFESAGTNAVPSLVRASTLPGEHRRDLYAPEVQRARYARQRLDHMDRLHPTKAVRAVRDDPERLVELLAAYADARVPDAADVLVTLVDDDSNPVRAAAREALLAYLRGPAPRPVRREIRLLGGHHSEAAAFSTFRQRAERAVREHLEAHVPALYDELCTPRCAAASELATRLFAWLDEAREARVARLLDDVTNANTEDRNAAIAALDALLASAPDLPHSERLAAVYWHEARHFTADRELERAAQRLRKTARLLTDAAPHLAERMSARALLVEAHTSGVTAAGAHMLLMAAHERAPDDPFVARAVEALPPLAAAVAPPPVRRAWWTASAWLLLLATCAAVWLLRVTWRGANRRRTES